MRMRFLPKDICEKLVEMGCKSNSGHWFRSDASIYGQLNEGDINYTEATPVFTLCDFVATEEYAKENCRKLLPEFRFKPSGPCPHCGGDVATRNPKGFCDHLYYPENCKICDFQHMTRNEFRKAIIDSPDAIEYISKAVEERVK
jgi:hypothetical protein